MIYHLYTLLTAPGVMTHELAHAFFCVFALGIAFKLALAANVINILGFLGLMWVAPVYGDRVPISMAFVSGSLFICVYARYRLDRSVQIGRAHV